MRQHPTELHPRVAPLTKRDRRYLQHRWHRELVALSSFVTIMVFLIAFFLVGVLAETDFLEQFLETEEFEKVALGALVGILSPFLLIGFRIYKSARHAATGAVASEQQFEHVYSITKHYSQLAGLKRIPTVAISNDVDFVAKTISNFGRAVIIVQSDLLDAPRPDSEDWGALRFAIAREVGHLAAGHRSFLYEMMTGITQAAPYLANPLLRTEAYTADRYAAVLAPDAASDYFAVDAVSKDCWQDMSIRAAVARAGKVRLGQMITGLIGDVPPTVWRLQTLARLGIFNCGVKPSYAKTPAEFREYLKQIPTVPVAVADLKQHHGSFLLPPKPMLEEDLDRLVPRGTNLELLSKAFAAYEGH